MIYVLTNNPILLIQISALSGIVENYSFLYLDPTQASNIVAYSIGLNLRAVSDTVYSLIWTRDQSTPNNY